MFRFGSFFLIRAICAISDREHRTGHLSIYDIDRTLKEFSESASHIADNAVRPGSVIDLRTGYLIWHDQSMLNYWRYNPSVRYDPYGYTCSEPKQHDVKYDFTELPAQSTGALLCGLPSLLALRDKLYSFRVKKECPVCARESETPAEMNVKAELPDGMAAFLQQMLVAHVSNDDSSAKTAAPCKQNVTSTTANSKRLSGRLLTASSKSVRPVKHAQAYMFGSFMASVRAANPLAVQATLIALVMLHTNKLQEIFSLRTRQPTPPFTPSHHATPSTTPSQNSKFEYGQTRQPTTPTSTTTTPPNGLTSTEINAQAFESPKSTPLLLQQIIASAQNFLGTAEDAYTRIFNRQVLSLIENRREQLIQKIEENRRILAESQSVRATPRSKWTPQGSAHAAAQRAVETLSDILHTLTNEQQRLIKSHEENTTKLAVPLDIGTAKRSMPCVTHWPAHPSTIRPLLKGLVENPSTGLGELLVFLRYGDDLDCSVLSASFLNTPAAFLQLLLYEWTSSIKEYNCILTVLWEMLASPYAIQSLFCPSNNAIPYSTANIHRFYVAKRKFIPPTEVQYAQAGTGQPQSLRWRSASNICAVIAFVQEIALATQHMIYERGMQIRPPSLHNLMLPRCLLNKFRTKDTGAIIQQLNEYSEQAIGAFKDDVPCLLSVMRVLDLYRNSELAGQNPNRLYSDAPVKLTESYKTYTLCQENMNEDSSSTRINEYFQAALEKVLQSLFPLATVSAHYQCSSIPVHNADTNGEEQRHYGALRVTVPKPGKNFTATMHVFPGVIRVFFSEEQSVNGAAGHLRPAACLQHTSCGLLKEQKADQRMHNESPSFAQRLDGDQAREDELASFPIGQWDPYSEEACTSVSDKRNTEDLSRESSWDPYACAANLSGQSHPIDGNAVASPSNIQERTASPYKNQMPVKEWAGFDLTDVPEDGISKTLFFGSTIHTTECPEDALAVRVAWSEYIASTRGYQDEVCLRNYMNNPLHLCLLGSFSDPLHRYNVITHLHSRNNIIASIIGKVQQWSLPLSTFNHIKNSETTLSCITEGPAPAKSCAIGSKNISMLVSIHTCLYQMRRNILQDMQASTATSVLNTFFHSVPCASHIAATAAIIKQACADTLDQAAVEALEAGFNIENERLNDSEPNTSAPATPPADSEMAVPQTACTNAPFVSPLRLQIGSDVYSALAAQWLMRPHLETLCTLLFPEQLYILTKLRNTGLEEIARVYLIRHYERLTARGVLALPKNNLKGYLKSASPLSSIQAMLQVFTNWSGHYLKFPVSFSKYKLIVEATANTPGKMQKQTACQPSKGATVRTPSYNVVDLNSTFLSAYPFAEDYKTAVQFGCAILHIIIQAQRVDDVQLISILIKKVSFPLAVAIAIAQAKAKHKNTHASTPLFYELNCIPIIRYSMNPVVIHMIYLQIRKDLQHLICLLFHVIVYATNPEEALSLIPKGVYASTIKWIQLASFIRRYLWRTTTDWVAVTTAITRIKEILPLTSKEFRPYDRLIQKIMALYGSVSCTPYTQEASKISSMISLAILPTVETLFYNSFAMADTCDVGVTRPDGE